jgi:hypothetical protein
MFGIDGRQKYIFLRYQMKATRKNWHFVIYPRGCSRWLRRHLQIEIADTTRLLGTK